MRAVGSMVNLMRNKKRRYLSNFGFAKTATLTPVAARSLALLGLTASVIRVRHEGEFDLSTQLSSSGRTAGPLNRTSNPADPGQPIFPKSGFYLHETCAARYSRTQAPSCKRCNFFMCMKMQLRYEIRTRKHLCCDVYSFHICCPAISEQDSQGATDSQFRQ